MNGFQFIGDMICQTHCVFQVSWKEIWEMREFMNGLKKDHYERIEMQIIDLDNEDIITTSDPSYPGEPDPIDENDEW